MNKPSEQLEKKITLMLALAVICTFLIAIAKPQVVQAAVEPPRVVGTNIYANGTPITIEAGSIANTTRIKLPNGSYLSIIDGKTEIDLSGYTIYGGKEIIGITSQESAVPYTSIIMTGGRVKSIYGGYYAVQSGDAVADTKVEIINGTILENLYGGGFNCGNGDANVIIRGGTINSVYGGNSKSIIHGNSNVNITGGTVGSVNGGNLAEGNVNVAITGGTITDVVKVGTRISGSKNAIIGLSNITTTGFNNLLQKTDSNWTITGNPIIPAGTSITIAENETMTIPQGSTLTIANGATLTNKGTIVVDGTLAVEGTLTAEGRVNVNGVMNATGTVNGSERIRYKRTITVSSWPIGSGIAIQSGLDYTNETKTVIAEALPGYYFAGWYQASDTSPFYTGKALYNNEVYTFSIIDDMKLVAVFTTEPVKHATVSFTSHYGQELITLQLSSCDLFTLPEGPARYGYTFTGWSMTEAEIKAKINADNSEITVTPSYALDDGEYDITINHGNGSGRYKMNSVVTAKAENPEEGKKFLYWKEDVSGNIVSYNTTYRFYANENTSITAYYDVAGTIVEAKGIAEIRKIKINDKTSSVSFVTMHTVPEGCTIKNAGIIATSDVGIGTGGDNFNKGNATYVRGKEWSGNAYRFTWTKKTSKDVTWYVKAYLVYQDASNQEVTIYSDMKYGSLNGVSN